MSRFYELYKDNEKVATLLPLLSWSHHGIIIDKCNIGDNKDYLRRIFYIKQSISQRLSVRDLEKFIYENNFDKFLLKQVNFDKTLSDNLQKDSSVVVKDIYNFNLLGLEENYSEKKLEDLLVLGIENTLKNFGSYFCFIGRQYKISVSGEDYYIDLLMYHRKLKCLVAIELKTTAFKPENAGKMAFYLSALENNDKLEGENPPVGIILCKSKDRTIVEYTLKDINKPLGIASYYTQYDLPIEFRGLLPSEMEIKRELDILE